MLETINKIKTIAETFCSTHSKYESMKFMLMLDNNLYSLIGNQSVRYDDGLHTKHRHINYHKYFVDLISDGESVLDLGCGIGAVADTIARERPKSKVSGIDLKGKNIDIANKRYKRNNLSFSVGDALNTNLNKCYDVIVLSNVLEHIQCRIDFILRTVNVVRPKRVLLRVPVFERDWKVPLKKELGVNYMLDPTHIVEHTQEEWLAEIDRAGLSVESYKVCWGELWANLHPSSHD